MSELLMKNGYVYCDDVNTADIVIINSCTVTHTSDNKNKKTARRIRRNNPLAIIVLTGCMPQAFPDDTDLFEDCDIVFGNTSRARIVPLLREYLENPHRIISIENHDRKNEKFEKMTVADFAERTRAFVKIEDGCNRFCSYCIIPFARGAVRSKDLLDLKNEAQALSKSGYREIVLVGINLSAYGQGTPYDLYDAVKCVCDTKGIERVRLGSLEPERMDEQMLSKLSKLKKFCPQFHLSLQSGCDATLKRMNRHYTCDEYKKIVSDIRKIFENPSVTTDVMVGFAGETDEEFKESLSFVDDIKFAKVHVFEYSQRRGTVAAKALNQVENSVKNIRSRKMIEITSQNRREFLNTQTGLVCGVLFETKRKDGYFEGYTKNYTPVRVQSDENLTGKIINVLLTKAFDDYCIGELVP